MQLRKLIYPAFLIFSLIVFWNTKDYGFVTDYLGWLIRYKEGGWKDILTCFGYPGLHQFFHFINYSLYKITNANIQAMGIIFICTHATVGYVSYRVFRLLLEQFDLEKSGIFALITGVLTTLSPYCVETITWDACYHYMLCTGLTLLSLKYLIDWQRRPTASLLFLHLVFFVLALLTIELALVAPGIFVIYSTIIGLHNSTYKATVKRGLQLIAIYLLIIALYFILTKLTIGAWIGHYGAAQHLVFTPTLILGTLLKYLVKFSFWAHFWAFNPRQWVYGLFNNILIILPIILSIIGLIIYQFRSNNRSNWITVGSLICFAIALLPVLNLFFITVVPYENDRYSYYASPYFYLFITLALSRYFKNNWAIPVLVFLAINCYFLREMIGTARQAGNVSNGLTKSFRWENEENVVLLCVPENMKGAYLFRDYSTNGITMRESLEWIGKKNFKGTFTNISQFNLTSDRDSVTVQVLGPNKLQVNIASWGTWFWYKGNGLSAYETDDFKITPGELNFQLEIKDTTKQRTYLYTVGDQWRAIVM
jgi:hypothetical protein